jgi:hypothetical protein
MPDHRDDPLRLRREVSIQDLQSEWLAANGLWTDLSVDTLLDKP